MISIPRAFDELLRRIELTDSESNDASRQHVSVRETLARHLGPGLTKSFLAGSYMRRTAIRPLHDIDFFAVFSDNRLVNQPADVSMGRIEEALRQKFTSEYNIPKRQNRSVHIDFAGTKIGYDIVPAVEFNSDIYQIPDRRRDGWIKTNPKKHQEIATEANKTAGDKLKPLIKLCKLWNRAQGKLMSSFHLEVMAYSAFRAPPPSYPEGFAALLAHLARRLPSRTADPAGVGPDIDEGWNEQDRRRAITIASEHAEQARRAIQLEDHSIFRKLLGQDYRAE